MGEASSNYVVALFVDNGLVATRCLEWIQSWFTILVTLFERIGLQTNAAKTKVMTCLLGWIQVAQMEEEYARTAGRGCDNDKALAHCMQCLWHQPCS
jgi:hypothetical protein